MLELSGSSLTSLSLLEINTWSKDSGKFVVASPPLRLERKQFSPKVLFVNETEEISETNPGTSSGPSAEKIEKNKSFWNEFIEECQFDHPDQGPLRRLNINSIRVPFPAPVDWVTCYRLSSGKKRIGIFMSFTGKDGVEAYKSIEEQRSRWEEEIPGIGFLKAGDKVVKKGFPQIYVSKEMDIEDERTIDEQKRWLHENINKWVNLFRPTLSALERAKAS
jgi:hypothetical protein